MRILQKKQENIPGVAQAPNLKPALIVEIELGQPLPTLSALNEKTGQYYRRAICLVRLHSQPLGLVELPLEIDRVSADEYVPQIWRSLGEKINEHLRRDGLPAVTGLDVQGLSGPGTPACIEEREQFLADAPFVSVIVPTHNRPERVKTYLSSLLAQHYPYYEIIVVDNAPDTTATAEFIQKTYGHVPQIRYLREDRPGGSWARNCGIAAAKGEILAFIDDDIVVDRYWLAELVRGFSRTDDVMCVTGLILPYELETPPQFWIEQYGGFSKGFTRRIFDLSENHPQTPLYPYTAGSLGSGANMAFKAAFLRSVGGFDPALGPGSLAQGGEDLTAFFQVIMQGHTLIYEPASLAYHPHHREYAALQKQIYSYGIGLAAYLTKNLLDNPRLLFDLIPRLPYGLVFTLSSGSPKNCKKSQDYPSALTITEIKGMLRGPFVYLQSKRKNLAQLATERTVNEAKSTPTLLHHTHNHSIQPSAGTDLSCPRQPVEWLHGHDEAVPAEGVSDLNS